MEGEAEDEVEGGDLEDDNEDAGEDEGDEDVSFLRLEHTIAVKRALLTYVYQAEDTAKSGGPAAAAKAAKGRDVPQEKSLDEVEELE